MSKLLTANNLRIAASAVLAALAVLAITYPHQVWIPVAIAALGALGIHTIPAVGQTTTPVTNVSTGPLMRGNSMTEPVQYVDEPIPANMPTGAQLMGLSAPVAAPPADAAPDATVAPQAPVAAPPATPAASMAATVRAMAGQLLMLADQLEN